MPATRPLRRTPEEPPALHDEALQNLRYIRDTMEATAAFTAVPGRGMVTMGAIALVTAGLTRGVRPDPASVGAWLGAWLGAASAALLVGLVAMAQKSRAAGQPLLTAAGRRFALAFAPPVLAGAVVTVALMRAGHVDLLPGLWLLLYGVATLAGGAHSVPAVPAMGGCFTVLGAAAMFTPAAWATLMLALGFGVLHVVFGFIVWRRHGG